MSEVKIDSEVSRVDGQLTVDYKENGISISAGDVVNLTGNINIQGELRDGLNSISLSLADAHKLLEENNIPETWDAVENKLPNLRTLRIATQVRELVLQGVTIKNTVKEMHEVWLSLYTEDQQCLITDMTVTKVRAQLIIMYTIKLIKYLNSIVGLDLVPLAQQVSAASIDQEERDPAKRSWKLDAILLNVGSNKITGHEDLFTTLLVNLFGANEDFIKFSLDPTWEGLRASVLKTYDYDLGDTEGLKGTPSVESADLALQAYLIHPERPYNAYLTQ